jgi:hypothetical protein
MPRLRPHRKVNADFGHDGGAGVIRLILLVMAVFVVLTVVRILLGLRKR